MKNYPALALLILFVGLTWYLLWISSNSSVPVGDKAPSKASQIDPQEGPLPPDDQAPSTSGRTDSLGDPLPPGAKTRLGTFRFQHGGSSVNPAFCPNTRNLISVGRDNSIRLWDTVTGKEIRPFHGPTAQVRSIAVAPNGKFLAAGDSKGSIWLWDIASGKKLHQLVDPPGEVDTLSFAPNSRILASGGYGNPVRCWDIPSGKEVWKSALKGEPVSCVAFSPAGKTMAVAHCDGIIHIRETGSWKEVDLPLGHSSPDQGPHFLAFSPEGKILASGGASPFIYLWDTAKGKEIRHFYDKEGNALRLADYKDPVTSLAYSPDGRLLVSGHDLGTIRWWDPKTGKEVRNFRPYYPSSVTGLAFSPDGRTLASGALYENMVCIWEVRTGKEHYPYPGGTPRTVSGLAFAPDGKTVTVRGFDGAIRQWDVAAGRLLKQWKGPPAFGTFQAYSSDYRMCAWEERGQVVIRDLVAQKEIRQFPSGALCGGEFAISPDGRLLAGILHTGQPTGPSRPTAIHLWNLATGREQCRIPAGDVGALRFSPDGQTLLAGHSGGLFLWRPATQQHFTLFKHERIISNDFETEYVPHLTFSPDGRNFSTSIWTTKDKPDDVIRLWETATARIRLRIRAKISSSVVMSPDGKLLAWVEGYRTIRLWDLDSGRMVGSASHGHQAEIWLLAFSPDGKILASAGGDSTVLLWDVPSLVKKKHAKREVRFHGKLGTLWEDLASADAMVAYQAIRALAGSAAQAVPFLEGRLEPVHRTSQQQLAELIRALDSPRYTVRSKAFRELQDLEEVARTHLVKAIGEKHSVESSHRLKQLLAQLERWEPRPDQLRRLRAVETLEFARTDRAKKLLEKLAGGAKQARLTQEAKAALQRLNR
jgi:WD40 repeat protein